ncbi:MAG TPA: cytochrome c nitrite reductase small subunit [Propionibacterium sp.]|nr:cytochrome c nitrite reductase small subunit [Propionibacterium sp.]
MATKPKGLLGILKSYSGVAIGIAGGLVGILLGIAVFTFGYAGGWAYFGNDPQTCNQCHAMNEQYDGWLKGSHTNVAGCNDCHSPHDNIISKYVNKADNGFWHALKFTTRQYPENIKIRDMNRQVTQDACIYCHGGLVEGVSSTRTFSDSVNGHSTRIDCLQCHAEVGHMR